MKFGCDFYTGQIPQWTNAYLDYDGLKQTLKQKSPGDQRYDSLQRSLEGQTARLNQFVEKQSGLVSLWFQNIKARFSLQSATPTQPDWEEVALAELRDLEFNLLEVSSFVEQLELFSRVNRDAIARILHKAKVAESWTLQNHSNGPLYLRTWSAETAQMMALLRAVQRAIELKLETDNVASRSLILDTVDPVALGCPREDVVDEIRADNSSALMIVLESPVPYLENQAMLYSVTQVAIAHQSIDCIESLLDEITATLDGELCIHQDPLQQLITHSGHTDIVSLFVDLDIHRADGEASVFTEEIVGSLMNIAIRSASSDIVYRLIKLEKGLNPQKQSANAPLYHAARLDHAESVKSLLDSTVELDLSRTDDSYHWTPLTVACVYGHLEVARLLLLAGANTRHTDRRGWSPLDHAAYRGHMSIVDLLQNTLPTSTEDQVEHKASALLPPVESITSVNPRPTYVTTLSSDDAVLSSVFVNLGSFDVVDRGSPVNLEGHLYEKTKASVTPSQTYLEVSATDQPDVSHRVTLPLLGDKGDTTWQFLTENADRMKLSFKLFDIAEESTGKPNLIASAIALLDSIKGWFRPERQSLRRDSAVALITPAGDFIGFVSFTFLVCKPYVPKHDASANRPQKMRSLTPAQVIGHRGLGLNENELRRLQIGEHTLLSLESALDNGAHFIEFDVQVTRDRVPVIYHAPRPTTNEKLKRTTLEREPINIKKENESTKGGLNTRPFLTRGGIVLRDERGLEPYATEMNQYLDDILDVVFELGQNRSIFFTCFNPEICILLSTKQKTYPVIFLNDSMVSGDAGDRRATSLQQAIRFARQWDLQGIVMAAEPLVAAPRLIRHVKELGLFCASYGALNDIPDLAK
ncbi:Glycerophosphoryl diester phosphodiesterase family-domain-containing protein, partial [Apiospora marii]